MASIPHGRSDSERELSWRRSVELELLSGQCLLGRPERRWFSQVPAEIQSKLQEFCQTGVLVVCLPRPYTVSTMLDLDAWFQRFWELDSATKDTLSFAADKGYVRCLRKEMFHIRLIDETANYADFFPRTGQLVFDNFQTMAKRFLRRLCQVVFPGDDEPIYEFFTKLFNEDSSSRLTVFNYFEQEVTVDHCPPHTDKGVITLIVSMISGGEQVEVETSGGQWLASGRHGLAALRQCSNGHVLEQCFGSADDEEEPLQCSFCHPDEDDSGNDEDDDDVKRPSLSWRCNECPFRACACDECAPYSKYSVTVLAGHTLEVASDGRCKAAVHRVINDGQPRRSLAFKVRGPPELEVPCGVGYTNIGQVLAQFESEHPSVNAPCPPKPLSSTRDSSTLAVRSASARAEEGDCYKHSGLLAALEILAGPRDVGLLSFMRRLECQDIARCSPVCWRLHVAAEMDALWIRPCLKLGLDWVRKGDAQTWSSFYGHEFLRVSRWSHAVTVWLEGSGWRTITKATRISHLRHMFSPPFPRDLFLLYRKGNGFALKVRSKDVGLRVDDFLSLWLPPPGPSRTTVERVLRDGGVLLNGAPVRQSDTRVQDGDSLVWLPGTPGYEINPEAVPAGREVGSLLDRRSSSSSSGSSSSGSSSTLSSCPYDHHNRVDLFDSLQAEAGVNPMCGDIGIEDGDILCGVREAKMKRAFAD